MKYLIILTLFLFACNQQVIKEEPIKDIKLQVISVDTIGSEYYDDMMNIEVLLKDSNITILNFYCLNRENHGYIELIKLNNNNLDTGYHKTNIIKSNHSLWYYNEHISDKYKMHPDTAEYYSQYFLNISFNDFKSGKRKPDYKRLFELNKQFINIKL